ncbi:carbohydrate ABC transporter permease [Paenibacillus sp. P26]|nr:carbohydrate ABC transporter permease [Paenibacillus sp. P26]
MLLITSLKDRGQIIRHFWYPALPLHFDHYTAAFVQITPYLIHSVLITAGLVGCVLLNGLTAGYAFARFQFAGKALLFMLVLLLLMVPGFLLLIPQFLLFKQLGLLNTLSAQFLGPMAGASSMAVLLIRSFFEQVPKPLTEAVEMEGAGDLRVLLSVMLPLSLPVVATVSVMNALLGWNNYVWPLVVTSDERVKPVILALTAVKGPTDHIQGIQLAGYVIASAPLLLLFLCSTRAFVAGVTSGAVKS